MSDSPIFDQLQAEYALREQSFESLSKWSTPAFRWTGSDRNDQSTKRPGVKLGKTIGSWIDTEHIEAQSATTGFGRLIQDYVSQVGQSFADQHPLAVVTDMHTETNDDGSATVVFEAVQPITSVMPLSERNSAEPME